MYLQNVTSMSSWIYVGRIEYRDEAELAYQLKMIEQMANVKFEGEI